MNVNLKTFGYRYKRTEPVGADVVFDARCLAEDPAEKETLGPLSGRDAPVADYLSRLPDVQRFIDAVMNATYGVSGWTDFTVAVACHSGKHRSVFIAEEVARKLHLAPPVHLDIDRAPLEDGAPDFV